jgi:IS30 family transposase
MPKEYHHLTEADRETIQLLLDLGLASSAIGRAIGRDKSTIYREINRNASPEYQRYLTHRAETRAVERRKQASRRRRLKTNLIEGYVREKLNYGWSPEQISGRLPRDHPGHSISHEAIYQFIYHQDTPDRGKLIECLRRAHRKRKNKAIGRKQRKTRIPNRVPIDKRPQSVETRKQFGHWEGDSLVSRESLAALNSLTERKSRLLLLTKLPRKEADETVNAVIMRLQRFPDKARRTLTLDNGTENAAHQVITAAVGTRCYFANPYHSWERGTNENTNGLVRWYLPKGTDFSKITDLQLSQIENLINNRPRKCLGFKTPLEVASACVALRS